MEGHKRDYKHINTKALFASLEGKRGEGLEKRKEYVEEIDDIGRRGFWGVYFT